MAQTTDIELNSAGYMIEPGTPSNPGYRQLQDGHPEGLTQRTSITDFFGGQRRTHQLERDKFYDSLTVAPALGGQGVIPWPRQSTIAATTTNIVGSAPNANQYMPHVIVRDTLYFALGQSLYKGPITTPSTGNTWTLLKTFDAVITDLTIYASFGILLAFGSDKDIAFRHTITGVDTTLYPGERAHRIEAYAGYALWIDARAAATPANIRMVTGDDIQFRNLSYDGFAMTAVGGEIMLITKQALFTFSGMVDDVMIPNPGYNPASPGTTPPTMPGQKWTQEFKPFYQQGVYNESEDFRFVAGYGGKTLAWIAGGVHELTPSGDRAGWTSTGLTGKRCFGGTIAAGFAIVCIESHSSNNEIWAYDGNGWWCIARKPMPTDGTFTNTWCNPMPIGQGGVYNNVVVMRHGSAIIDAFRLVDARIPGGTYLTNYPNTESHFVTPLIDASDRDKLKAWRKIGAVFSSPELYGDTTSGDNVTVSLDYSTNAGQTWTEAATESRAGNTIANMNFDLEASLQGVVSRFLQLRVRWESVNNWAPILTGIWAEHEVLSSPARRRKWTLRIHARDQEIDHDGVTLTRTGRQLIEELWTAWETDTPMTFRDADYDTDPTQRTVRIVGIQEHVAQPADAQSWGDSLITLNLVEV